MAYENAIEKATKNPPSVDETRRILIKSRQIWKNKRNSAKTNLEIATNDIKIAKTEIKIFNEEIRDAYERETLGGAGAVDRLGDLLYAYRVLHKTYIKYDHMTKKLLLYEENWNAVALLWKEKWPLSWNAKWEVARKLNWDDPRKYRTEWVEYMMSDVENGDDTNRMDANAAEKEELGDTYETSLLFLGDDAQEKEELDADYSKAKSAMSDRHHLTDFGIDSDSMNLIRAVEWGAIWQAMKTTSNKVFKFKRE
jgi:hypothetical protein